MTRPRCVIPLLMLGFVLLVPSGTRGQAPYQQQKNVVYAEVDGVGLLMDVFTPSGKRNGLGIVDVISGAWHSDRGKLRDHQRAQVFDIMCEKGYTVFAVRPGSVGRFTVPEMLDHVNRGIRWVKTHAEDYAVDPDRLGLMGASAGGHLAALAGVTAKPPNPNTTNDAPNDQSPSRSASDGTTRVKAVGVFFPPTDFLNYGGREIDVMAENGLGAVVRSLVLPNGVGDLSRDEVQRRVIAISPARLVTPQAPPFLLIHGNADFLVPLQQSREMRTALQQAGVPAKLIVKNGGGHPWPTIHEEVRVMADWFDKQLTQTAPPQPPGDINASHPITIDGHFGDWAGIKSYFDPPNDTHDTGHNGASDAPGLVKHPDVDLLEYKLTHDAQTLYLYFRARGQIGRTQKEAPGKPAGRYYVIAAIDVDHNDETGYRLHEGGYYPSSPGYDVNAEIEFYNGEFNTGDYLNHGARNEAELAQAYLDQSTGKYVKGKDGPYPAGFISVRPGTYKHYTQWVYHKNDTITFVRDKGPVVPGVITAKLSDSGHELEMAVPMKGFLTDAAGNAVVAVGNTLDVSFSLEASGELAPDGQWASDTAAPIQGYVLTSP